MGSERTHDKPVRAEFRKLRESLAGALGIDHDKLDAYRWFAACRALENAKSYHWLATARWSDEVPYMTLVVDRRGFGVFGHERVPADGPDVAAAEEFFSRYAHVEAVKGPLVRTSNDFREWRKETEAEAPVAPSGP